jgi:hypothetical protein
MNGQLNACTNKQKMKGQTDEYTNKWMTIQMNKQKKMDEQTGNEQKNKWMYQRTNKWMKQRNKWTKRHNKWMKQQNKWKKLIEESTEKWMNGEKDKLKQPKGRIIKGMNELTGKRMEWHHCFFEVIIRVKDMNSRFIDMANYSQRLESKLKQFKAAQKTRQTIYSCTT